VSDSLLYRARFWRNARLLISPRSAFQLLSDEIRLCGSSCACCLDSVLFRHHLRSARPRNVNGIEFFFRDYSPSALRLFFSFHTRSSPRQAYGTPMIEPDLKAFIDQVLVPMSFAMRSGNSGRGSRLSNGTKRRCWARPDEFMLTSCSQLLMQSTEHLAQHAPFRLPAEYLPSA
jgi:hypothetical protein